jgi:hypothetical protein
LSWLVTLLILIAGTGLPARAAPAGQTAAGTAATPVVGPDIPVYVEDKEQRHVNIAYNWKHDEWSGGGRDIDR